MPINLVKTKKKKSVKKKTGLKVQDLNKKLARKIDKFGRLQEKADKLLADPVFVELADLKAEIEKRGCGTLVVDTGVLGDVYFEPDISRSRVAQAGGSDLGQLLERKDRGEAMAVMTKAVDQRLPVAESESRGSRRKG